MIWITLGESAMPRSAHLPEAVPVVLGIGRGD